MKTILHTLHSTLLLFLLISQSSLAQLQVDTIAYQDFETVPAAPVWGYTGTLADVQSGLASATSSIPNTPVGINASQAWHVAQVSGGNLITFDNTAIPAGYDSIRVNFRLAALNLQSSGGGPDDLDYVLVEYSLDNGVTFVNRLRIRGSVLNNSFWAYDATGVAAVPYLPANETVFQPLTSSGLQDVEGYSFCEISFPGTISQVMIRITPRSSSSTDSWLIDDLVLTGETQCTTITSSIAETVCGSYSSPGGNVYTTSGIYNDTLQSVLGCDSIVSINLTVNPITATTITEIACDSYTAPSGAVYTTSGSYDDFLTSSAGCDSTITINLTVNSSSASSVTDTGIDIYTAPSGATYTTSGIYTDTIPNAAGCDSVITIDLTMSFSGLDEGSTSFITISPNPAHDFISIDGLQDAIGVESVSIVDLTGSITQILEVTDSIDVSELALGVYFLRVKHSTGIEQLRFVKE